MSTIAAISTAPGTGGIAVIRITGNEAIKNCNLIFRKNGKENIILSLKGQSIIFGHIVNDTNEIIDEVLVSVFRTPHSFTGEDVVEISCHGSIFIQQTILNLLLSKGCELAKPGEFTQRAFFNGKMDLSQAEGVADLIAAKSASAHKTAINQMRGGFSKELKGIRSKLLDFVSLIELELDFTEEDVEFANRTELHSLAQNISSKIKKLSDSFEVGNAIKNGIPVAIIGETNVGKSTLLNLLLNEDRAIVSEIHGTTRDVIEDQVSINGIIFRFIDTAGIRKTEDQIENIGIEKTFQKIEQASIILWLLDSTKLNEHSEWLTEKIEKKALGKKIILVFNKIDKIEKEEQKVLEQLFESHKGERVYISAKKNTNTIQLENTLIKVAQIPDIQTEDVVITNARHFEALRNANTSIERVLEGITNNISTEFLSQDIRECMHYLGEITGQISNDEVLGNIFGKFCIGK